MSLEAIKAISDAEEKSLRDRQEAVQSSKRAVADAEKSGQARVDEAAAKANEELAGLRKQAMDKARQEALELLHSTENRKAAMLVRSESRKERAIDLVIERIVRS